MFLHHFSFFTNLLDNNLNAPNQNPDTEGDDPAKGRRYPHPERGRRRACRLSRARHSRHMSEEEAVRLAREVVEILYELENYD
jgi:hypothetical protein